uniref:Uncharacterized protein n=1 Tax=Ascaris lumbricoides TaxID=6252 RepID=A0A0M3I2V5_ASCLU
MCIVQLIPFYMLLPVCIRIALQLSFLPLLQSVLFPPLIIPLDGSKSR